MHEWSFLPYQCMNAWEEAMFNVPKVIFGAFHCTGLYCCSNGRSKSVCGKIERWDTSKQEWVCKLVVALFARLDFRLSRNMDQTFHKVVVWKETPTNSRSDVKATAWSGTFRSTTRQVFLTVAGKIQFTWQCKNHPFLGSIDPWEKGQVNMSQINNGKPEKWKEMERNDLHSATLRWQPFCRLWHSGVRAICQSQS